MPFFHPHRFRLLSRFGQFAKRLMSRSHIHGNPLPRSLIFTLVVTLQVCPVQAQRQFDLRNLVFEPVPLEDIPAFDQSTTFSAPAIPEVMQSGQTASEYRATQLSPASGIDSDAEISESIARYVESITNLELTGGAYEPALSQEYLSLGTLYQQQGEHQLALDTFDKALHISRINLGLFDLDQEPIIKKKIESFLATGDLHAADMQQEYLFFLKQKAFGASSLDLLPALTEYADWNIFAFDARLMTNPALSYAASSRQYDVASVNNTIGEENFRTLRLVHAQNIYHSIIQILLSNFGNTDPRLLDMERNLALTNYFFATNISLSSSGFEYGSQNNFSILQNYDDRSTITNNSMGYRHGRAALERRIEYMQHMEGLTSGDIANARQELGDWLLIFKKRIPALEIYQGAYDELLASGVQANGLERIFNPPVPRQLPEFIDYRFTRGALGIPEDVALKYLGHLDMQFEIDRFGKTQNIVVLGKSENTPLFIEEILLNHLDDSLFRPRIQNGKLVETDQVTLRYFYTY